MPTNKGYLTAKSTKESDEYTTLQHMLQNLYYSIQIEEINQIIPFGVLLIKRKVNL